jgi:hypothetical protein
MGEERKMNIDLIIEALIIAAFSFLKQQGLSDEEAKIKAYAKIDQIAALPDLPSPATQPEGP